VATSADTAAFKDLVALFPTSAPVNLAPTGAVYKPLYVPNQLTWDAPAWGSDIQEHIVGITYTLDYYSKLTTAVTADDPNFLKPANNVVTVANVTSPYALNFAYDTTYFWRVTATTTWDSNSITGNLQDVDFDQERFDVQPSNTAPIPNAGNSIITWLDKAQGGVQLGGSVIDAEDDATTSWTAYRLAFGTTVPAAEVIFADAGDPATTVTISTAGDYILKLSAWDTQHPVPTSSQMKITVYTDACLAAKANPAGYTKSPYDFDDDCVVEIDELVKFAERWLNSTAATSDSYFAATVGDPSRALIVEYWTGITGSDPNVILSDPRYPNEPTGKGLLTGGFTQGDRGLSDFSQRIRGYIVPPTTGSYIFYIASDDASDLFLSPGSDPANMVKIAEVNGFTGTAEWTKEAGQTSAAQSLTAGTYYYVEVLHKEQSGGDHVSVAWSTDGGTTKTVIPASALRWNLP
jgi:hypothetical protein